MNCALFHSLGTPEARPYLSWKFSKAKQETSLRGALKLVKDMAPSDLMNHLLTHSAFQWVQCIVGVQPMITTLIIIIVIVIIS